MNMLRKPVISLIVLLTFAFQFGCSAFAPRYQSLTVTATETDAQIFINGLPAGKGRAVTRVPRDQDVALMAKKDGFEVSTKEVPSYLGKLGILDIVGGIIWLVPFVGLFFPGSQDLDTYNVTLPMYPNSQPQK